MSVQSYLQTTPTEFQSPPVELTADQKQKIISYVVNWKRDLKRGRVDKVTIWNECWQLFRGKEDWSDKEEWQSKLVLPKAFSTVKQATNVIKRLLRMANNPWSVESTNPDDMLTQMRSEQVSDLTEVFLDKANYQEEFGEGLECGFIMGLGIWKLWWGYKPRSVIQVVPQMMMDPNTGQPTQTKQTVQSEILEGQLFIKAVDPYNFYWLPGSKLNRFAGTLEEVEVPKWELLRMAKQGVFDEALIRKLGTQKIESNETQSNMRFDEPYWQSAPHNDTGTIKLTEFYGPVIIDGEILDEQAHIIVANETELLVYQHNPFWHGKPPYVAFSPLTLPFRTEGVGLIEHVREVLKALSKLANLSVDTLMFRLLPIFDVTPEVYENPEDFETGMYPGKILRRSLQFQGQPGITPIQFEDISQGTIQVSAQLDRSHQEGALVNEIQQSLPRYRGYQSAAETEIKQENTESFFGSMASDIERQALEPMVEMATDLILQFIDTTSDPRVASILGVNQDVLLGMSPTEKIEMIQGDYKIKVRGLSGQLDKAEMLQNLVQFMNLIGQNPEAWLPYINQNEILKRILEAFRPGLHDIENIVVTPEVAAAREISQQTNRMTPDMLAQIPQLVAQATAAKQQEFDNQMALRQQAQQEAELKMQERVLQMKSRADQKHTHSHTYKEK
jgi:hypothetical protein